MTRRKTRHFDSIPYSVLIIASLTLGLAPFTPQPHLYEKLVMLSEGALTRGVDIFDLLFHAAPWLLLLTKGFIDILSRAGNANP
jgi:hypothetical protein